jgi:hypothetical protein
VIDVHARDVIQMMAENNVESEADFDWLSQLRCAASAAAIFVADSRPRAGTTLTATRCR